MYCTPCIRWSRTAGNTPRRDPIPATCLGREKILKKVGEECAETIIAAKNGVPAETVGEVSDLIYHLMVLLADQGIPLDDVMEELRRRSLKIGNLKPMKQVDRET